MNTQTETHLTPEELVARWKGAVTKGTLANWRGQGKGPRYVKLGRTPRYPISEVEAWEAAQVRANTVEKV